MFKDRKDAALQLARALEKYRDTDALVLGIPRGGAETAFYIAMHLHTELSVLVARKLSLPHNPEFAIGAIAEDGTVYLNEYGQKEVRAATLEQLKQQQEKEIERRVGLLRNGLPLPSLQHRTVILVDDGIATGATVFAAIGMCKKAGAEKIVVAVPVATKDMQAALQHEVDELIILKTPIFLGAVSLAYESFFNLTDEEALTFLQRWEKEHQAHDSFNQ